MYFIKYKYGFPNLLTQGKIYLAKDILETDSETREHAIITCDNGEKLKVSLLTDNFDKLSKIYVVCLRDIVDIKEGEVFLVTDTYDNCFRIRTHGYYNISNFSIIDQSLVFSGMYVCNKETGLWAKINSINEEMMFTTDLKPKLFQPPTDFYFAVLEKNILAYPIVYCVNSRDCENELTVGKDYLIVCNKTIFYTVKNDKGILRTYLNSKFSWKKPFFTIQDGRKWYKSLSS